MAQPLLRFFQFEHLPPRLQVISRPFAELARWINSSCPDNEQTRVGMQRLLEARDCIMRGAFDVALAGSIEPPPSSGIPPTMPASNAGRGMPEL